MDIGKSCALDYKLVDFVGASVIYEHAFLLQYFALKFVTIGKVVLCTCNFLSYWLKYKKESVKCGTRPTLFVKHVYPRPPLELLGVTTASLKILCQTVGNY